ncbi:MAG TPA: hypothetical protein PLE39_10695 [Anaerolineales bacterium]|nr:hypothetical protein [Anaerolineales bacterium]HNE68841.1 hypothetical protein [Anaerolineales bacterium]
MNKNNLQIGEKIETSLSALILIFLIFFSYAFLFRMPYAGFYFNPSEGRVDMVYVKTTPETSLQIGDILIKVGDITLDEFRKNRRLSFFENTRPEETVDILIRRDGQEKTIHWVFPGFTSAEFLGRFFNIWWLAFIFWLFGFVGQILIRPKDTRRLLLIAANYITSIWLITGNLSSSHLMESSTLMHATSWLLLPVYTHLHWIFPRPLNGLSKNVLIPVYGVSGALALGEILHILPRSFYVLGFLGALIGSLVLELLHFIRQKDQRQNVTMLAAGVFLAFAPTILFGLLILFSGFPALGPITFLALPFMPLTYFIVISRNQLGGVEVRANRLISIYAFLIILGSVLLFLIMPITLLPLFEGETAFVTLAISSLTSLISILVFPAFQAYVEQRFLGIKLPYQNIQESFSNRIAASASINDLLLLLENDVFPSLFIRQFAFIQTSNGNLNVLLAKNVSADEMPDEGRISQLVERSGKFIPTGGWIRLILPLKAGDSFIGFWLLGRRDPDDHYPQAEIVILQSIANQTAIALSYVLQTEYLKSIYQDGINQYEDERMRLALLLHDSILNELAVLRMNLNEMEEPPAFQNAYQKLTSQIREIIFNLRPPMLEYGLKPAIEEMAETLMEHSQRKIKVITTIETDGSRYQAGNMEEHIFRMVQEASENSARHAQGQTIQIKGVLMKGEISLSIEDDGMGFNTKDGLGIDTLVRKKHFGLAGILKRAQLIGAEVFINSIPEKGTHVQVVWKPSPIQG